MCGSRRWTSEFRELGSGPPESAALSGSTEMGGLGGKAKVAKLVVVFQSNPCVGQPTAAQGKAALALSGCCVQTH